MIEVRKFCDRDINYVMDIDLKSYYYPLNIKDWREFETNADYHHYVITKDETPVGFIVWHHEFKKREGELTRIGVLPSLFGKGLGSRLLLRVEQDAKNLGVKKLYLIVPDISCQPGEPDDVSVWLRDSGFKAVLPILKNHSTAYGKKVDAYRFEKEIKHGQ